MEWYHLHPIVVHFPIAFLTLGFAVDLMADRQPWVSKSATGLLWLGTLAVWATLGLGFLAENTAPHVPPAWEVLEDHETAGLVTVTLFSIVSFWRWRLTKSPSPSPNRVWILRLAWLICLASLFVTAYFGGELVYQYGMGVSAGLE